MNKHINAHAVKYLAGFVLVFIIRLLPFRPPNVEPVLATTMPFAKRFGATGGFLFAFLSIVLFDGITSGWGTWTLITALTYGIIGATSYYYFKRRESRVRYYVLFSVVATLFYDAVTGLTVGPLLWGQPFMAALVGQIPFTIMHLAGNVAFAAVLSPLVYRYLVSKQTTPALVHSAASNRP